MSKHVIIIGAGVAGLSAGIYACRSGFEVTIFEQHTIPGGMCTSWRRKGYFFEGGIHWLTGSSPKTELNELWRETGALSDGVKIRYDEPFRELEWESPKGSQKISVFRDIQKTRKHFKEISPEDEPAIESLIADIKAMSKVQMPTLDIKGVKSANPRRMGLGALIKMLPALRKMKQLSNMSIAEYLRGFKHPALREILRGIVTEEYNAFTMAVTLATLASGDGGYPEGGSLALARRMADTFTGLGGKILFDTKVAKVISQDGAAVGVSVNGAIFPADAVIVTQETLAAAEQLFATPPKDEWLAKLKRETKPCACCFVGVGIRASLPDTPAFKLSEPLRCGGFSYPFFAVNNYADYPGYAPEGCTALTTFCMGDSYDFWKKAREEGRYEDEKRAVAEQVKKIICEKYLLSEDKIAVIDVATPLTYERYTGASRGSWMSVMGVGKANMTASCPCTLEEMRGVYFAGHRTMPPGGLPVALSSGRAAAQMVCRQFGVMFR